MTNRSSLDEAFNEILKAAAEGLKQSGYVRQGHVFRLFWGENCGLIEFQRSVSNTSETLKFTVNLGVVCGELLGKEPSGIQSARIVDAHFRKRIGWLSPNCSDKWWVVTGSTDRALLTREVVTLLVDMGAPYVQSHIETKALIALWESGEAPGLTEFQRTQFLSKLESGHALHPRSALE